MEKARHNPDEAVIINFDRVWRFLPMNRPQKEFLKLLLFTFFPFIFRNWAVYWNWKNARCFGKGASNRSTGFRKAITPRECNPDILEESSSGGLPAVAVVIHAYYPELLEEMLGLLHDFTSLRLKLFVTCSPDRDAFCREILRKSSFAYTIKSVENRGRDILPFLKMAPVALSEGFEVILKLHTKKSMHLKRNLQWRNDLYQKLIAGDAPEKMVGWFQQHPDLGMIAPAGHILPMSLYYGANPASVRELCLRMGLQAEQLVDYIFVAGSMFAIRARALEAVLALNLTEEDFEPENRQVDGTMAHAVERIFTAALLVRGLTLCDTDSYTGRGGFRVSRNYTFTL